MELLVMVIVIWGGYIILKNIQGKSQDKKKGMVGLKSNHPKLNLEEDKNEN